MAFLLEKARRGLRKNVDILIKTDILRTMRSLSRMMGMAQTRREGLEKGIYDANKKQTLWGKFRAIKENY